MSRFRVMAGIFGVLTVGLAYEAALSAVNGVEAVFGIGVPRLVMPGLIHLGLAALTLTVAALTFRLARMQLTIARLQTTIATAPPNER